MGPHQGLDPTHGCWVGGCAVYIEEGEVSIITDSTSIATPATNIVAAIVSESNANSAEYTLLQKGLFLAVILGCVAAYMKMGNKKANRFTEKSMA
jgi:hypothetical protein